MSARSPCSEIPCSEVEGGETSNGAEGDRRGGGRAVLALHAVVEQGEVRRRVAPIRADGRVLRSGRPASGVTWSLLLSSLELSDTERDTR